MESAFLGLVLDSSAVISAERRKQPIVEFIEAILRAHGFNDLMIAAAAIEHVMQCSPAMFVTSGTSRASRLWKLESAGRTGLRAGCGKASAGTRWFRECAPART